MALVAELKIDGQVVSVIVAEAKTFSTFLADGKTHKTGYYGQGKVEHNGKRYQTTVQLVEISPKK